MVGDSYNKSASEYGVKAGAGVIGICGSIILRKVLVMR
jgi:hypothetical protein